MTPCAFFSFFQFLFECQFGSAHSIAPREHSSDGGSVEDMCTPALGKRLFPRGKALRKQPGDGRKEISSRDSVQTVGSLRTMVVADPSVLSRVS